MPAKVIKLAQRGFDVKTTGDENLIFNSEWPLLKIYKSGSFRYTDTATDPSDNRHLIVVEHNLGYIPVHWWFGNNDIHNIENTPPLPAIVQERAEFNNVSQLQSPAVTEKVMVYDASPGLLGGGTEQFYYYIFALDLTTAYKAPQIKTGGLSGSRAAKVFKLAKPNKSISSARLEDYVVHSAARSPLIHAVAPGVLTADAASGGSVFTYYHNLGYVPIYMAFIKRFTGVIDILPGEWRSLGSQASMQVDTQKITIQGTASQTGQPVSLVVLKDPFELDTIKVNV